MVSGGGVVATARRSLKTFIKRGEREIRRTRIDREGETERKTRDRDIEIGERERGGGLREIIR